MENLEARTSVKQGAVDAAPVVGIIVDYAIIILAQARPGKKFSKHRPVFHFGQTYNIGNTSIFISREHYRLRNSGTFVIEVRPGLKEVFHVPEHQQKPRPPVIGDGKAEK